ncbi:DUF4112 domain-containing protein [Rhodovulum sp. PH10]|uniref:DUF4112 domain-containing protein n=1 Tax=Rhodovulum sp. PH10 TaxID=1187851 RepID=UPI000A019AA5|nr:DUF4112 domain-containing protein [Rhodovulum sp. PH10]
MTTWDHRRNDRDDADFFARAAGTDRAARENAYQRENAHQRVRRLESLAHLLDTAIVVPGLGVRVGMDALIGLVPGIGDAATTLLSLWIVREAWALGAPRHVIGRMLANVAVDGAVGAVPLVGDAFDVMWRANRRNVRLLRDWLDREAFSLRREGW